ncbi:MAG: hypothetical protein M3297_02525 [Thermoproteota archaeon]|nr:hypothetical protein [Thermoproteota archaeon]
MRTGYWVPKRLLRNAVSNDNENKSVISGLAGELRPSRLTVLNFGLIAGLISSLAISGLILMVEKITAVPVGTFYMVVMAALTEAQLSSINMIVFGLSLHLVCGCIIGVVMSIPFTMIRKGLRKIIYQYAPVYGILFGLALWSIFFLPITVWMVLPLISSVDNQIIEQSVPTGPIASIETSKLYDMSNKIIFGALPFNVFYGLLVAIITNSLYQRYIHKKEIVENIS